MNLQLVDTTLSASVQYLFQLNIIILCYLFTLSPNLYSFFVTLVGIIFFGTTNKYLGCLILLAVACIPITYHFIDDDYVMLNMMTYFPYPERSSYNQLLSNVVIVTVIFLGLYGYQFSIQVKQQIKLSIGQVMRQMRENEL